ncbi:MAG: hypothetical protein WBQ20_03600 [Methyloceanibacter sp.]|jgi:hypothetical protein
MSERDYLLAAIERCEKRAKIASSDALYGKHEVSEKLQLRNPHAS